MLHGLFLRLALGLTLAATSTVMVGGGWWDDLFREQVVPLERILKAPESYRGLRVSFVIQFHRLGTVENPFFTRFEDDWFLNLSAWADSAPLWDKTVYKNAFPYLFVRRGTDMAGAVSAAPTYSRWAVVGEVADVFKGVPWIEIHSLRRLENSLDEPSLVRIVKGRMLRDHGRHEAAAQELRAAEHEGLPLAVRTLVMREEAGCLESCGKRDQAIARLNQALEVWPEDPHTHSALVALGVNTETKNPNPPATAPAATPVVKNAPELRPVTRELPPTEIPAAVVESTAPITLPEVSEEEVIEEAPVSTHEQAMPTPAAPVVTVRDLPIEVVEAGASPIIERPAVVDHPSLDRETVIAERSPAALPLTLPTAPVGTLETLPSARTSEVEVNTQSSRSGAEVISNGVVTISAPFESPMPATADPVVAPNNAEIKPASIEVTPPAPAVDPLPTPAPTAPRVDGPVVIIGEARPIVAPSAPVTPAAPVADGSPVIVISEPFENGSR